MSQELIRSYIEQYFTQLTRGCKENVKNHSLYCCYNPLCTKITDPNLAAVKAIEYAKSFKEKFLCHYLKNEESLVYNKESETLVDYFKRCQQANSYLTIVKFIKDYFSVPSRIEEAMTSKLSLDSLSISDKNRANDDFNYFRGMNLLETRETFKYLMALDRDDITNAIIESSKGLGSALKFNPATLTTPTSLIPIVFLLQNPIIYDLDHNRIFENLCNALFYLDVPMLNVLEDWLSNFSKDHFIQTLTNFEQFISVRLMTVDNINITLDKPIIGACAFLELLNNINLTKKYVNHKEFYNDLINNFLTKGDIITDFSNFSKKTGFTFTTYPFILNIDIKSTYLQIEYTLQQKKQRSEYLVFQVRRENIIDDALNNIQNHKHPEEMKKELKIQFKGEDGIDQGGVQKEFFQIVVRKIFDPEFGMFKYNESLRTWWFNPNSLDKLEFELIGIILGLALYNNIILDVHFPLVVYKKLLGFSVDIDDIESVDPELYRSLIKLRDTDDDVSNWMTTFSVSIDHFGETRIIELKPGGDDIIVTNENRHEYLKLYTHYLLESSICTQWTEFYKGFKLVCDSPLLKLLRPEELEDLICGVEDLDFTELEKVAVYEGGYTKEDQTIIYFWDTIHHLTNEMKKKFLSFTTGSDRVPYGGLSKIHFSIHKQIDSDRLPSAHTCFNALILPCYPTREKLEDRLMKALNNAEGFGLK